MTLNPPSPTHPTVTFEHSPIFSIPCPHHMCVHPLSNILRPAAAPAVHQSRRLSRGAPVRVSAPRRPPSAASRLPVPAALRRTGVPVPPLSSRSSRGPEASGDRRGLFRSPAVRRGGGAGAGGGGGGCVCVGGRVARQRRGARCAASSEGVRPSSSQSPRPFHLPPPPPPRSSQIPPVSPFRGRERGGRSLREIEPHTPG